VSGSPTLPAGPGDSTPERVAAGPAGRSPSDATRPTELGGPAGIGPAGIGPAGIGPAGIVGLFDVDDLGAEGIAEVLSDAEGFEAVLARPIPTVPALRGRAVATAFFEPSTRTRLSFETAARRLSADVLTFATQGSSLSKGESLADTVRTLRALGADLLVVRHQSAGVPYQVARWSGLPVVNGGDGAHAHPTQALLDCAVLTRRLGDLAGRRILILGDVAHSRVARSLVSALVLLGADVVLVGPPTLLAPGLVAAYPGGRVRQSEDLDRELPDVDAVYLLRLQHERMVTAGLLPELAEYVRLYRLDRRRASRLSSGVPVLHPGPMNRGVEIDPEVADSERSLITEQVRMGVPVRMAVLWRLLRTPEFRPAALTVGGAEAGTGTEVAFGAPGGLPIDPASASGIDARAPGAVSGPEEAARMAAPDSEPASGGPRRQGGSAGGRA